MPAENTIYLPAFIEALRETLYEEKLITQHDEGDQVVIVPVVILFKAEDGTPIEFPLVNVGIRADDSGQAVALVFTTTQQGDFNAANQDA